MFVKKNFQQLRKVMEALINKNILVLKSVSEFIQWRQSLNNKKSVNENSELKNRIGFVPTMGALHFGHETLLKQARAENDWVVLSIFVNPTQFNDKKDLEKYPKTWDQDLAVAQRAQVDVIFFPTFEDMYPDNYKYKISETDFSNQLCGAHRPGHFDGVLSVVMKLFQIVQPTKAYFGEKDYQQLQLIRGMVRAFFLPLEIVPVPTVRETDGLAMSSRNVRLTSSQRQLAPWIYKIISNEKDISIARQKLQDLGFKVDYLQDFVFEGNVKRRFVAAFLGDVRLIDNTVVNRDDENK